MKIVTVAAAFCAVFFVGAPMAVAEPVPGSEAAPLVLVKESLADNVTFEPEDFPWGLPEGRTEDVRVPLGGITVTMPWMAVEKDGDDAVTITAPEARLLGDPKGHADSGAAFEDISLRFERGDDAMTATGTAASIVASSHRSGEPSVSLEGFAFQMTAEDYEPALASLEAGDKAGTEAMMAAVRPLSISLAYSVESSTMKIDTTENDNDRQPVDLMMTTGRSDAELILREGALSLSTEGIDNAFALKTPMSLDGEIGLIAYSFAMPVNQSPDPQPLAIAFELGDVAVDDAIWAMVDPGEIFPRALNAVKLDLVMEVILNESIFDTAAREARAGTGENPFVPVGATLKTLVFDGLGLDVSGEGSLEMDGEQPKNIEAFLSVAGLSGFMANAVEAGFLPQSQAIMAEGVALQFGNENDDESLTFDVETRDGVIFINGNRVAPLPK